MVTSCLLTRMVSRLFCSDSRYVLRSTSAAWSSAASDAAEALDQLDRTFVADAGRAGNVVDGIAAQGHHVDDLLRRHAENFLDLGGIADQVILRRIQHADAVVDQLHHVLVAGDDEDGVALVSRLVRQRADDVVGFEAGHLEDRNAIRLERAADVRHLLRQVGRHGGAIGLVAVVGYIDVGLRLAVELAKLVIAVACSSRKVGALTSKTAARYCGAKSARSLRSMFTKTNVALVGMPVLVDIGRCRAMA